MNVAVFIGALIGMVVLHEIGHFAAAKWTGMRVEKFSLFFGRALVSRTRGETEYRIGWMPLGGYVKISGMSPEEELPAEVAPRAYYRQATWRRVVVILAGPLVNVVVALGFFCAFYLHGIPVTGQTIASVVPDSPAAQAGITPGDRLVGVGDLHAEDRSVGPLRAQIVSSAGERVVVTVVRDGKPVRLPVSVARVEGGGQIGVRFVSERATLGPLEAVKASGQTAWWQTRTAGEGLWRLVSEEDAHKDLTTVVGITAAYDDVAGLGLALYFIGAVSLLLGLFNLLPLLPLDGGHILFALLERVRGRAFSTRTYQLTMLAGLGLMLIGLVFGLMNDFSRISSGDLLG